MINQQIDALKSKLNDMIENQNNYSEIYSLSVEIDELITRFYTSVERTRRTYTELYLKNS